MSTSPSVWTYDVTTRQWECPLAFFKGRKVENIVAILVIRVAFYFLFLIFCFLFLIFFLNIFFVFLLNYSDINVFSFLFTLQNALLKRLLFNIKNKLWIHFSTIHHNIKQTSCFLVLCSYDGNCLSCFYLLPHLYKVLSIVFIHRF